MDTDMLPQELELRKKALYRLINLFKNIFILPNRIFAYIEYKCQVKDRDNLYLSFVENGELALSKEQHKSIDELYSRYCRIRHCSHAFYTAKTGVFDNRYIPDSLHHWIIDQFFNNWSAAKYIDNKCYYPLMFQDVNIPTTVAYRLNGFWYQKWGCVIDYQQVAKIVMNEEECFIKKATDSWGGLGVVYFKPSEHTIEELKEITSVH